MLDTHSHPPHPQEAGSGALLHTLGGGRPYLVTDDILRTEPEGVGKCNRGWVCQFPFLCGRVWIMNQNFLGISALEGRRDQGDSALPQARACEFPNITWNISDARNQSLHLKCPSIHPPTHSSLSTYKMHKSLGFGH